MHEETPEIVGPGEAAEEAIRDALSGQARYGTGYESFDARFGAIGAGEFGIISARSSAGKSTLILNMVARTPAVPTVVFSKEMEAKAQTLTLACILHDLNVSAKDIQGVLADPTFPLYAETLVAVRRVRRLLPYLFFHWPTEMSPEAMLTYCDAVQRQTGVKVERVYIDHLTLMPGKEDKETVNRHAKMLKDWAAYEGIAVIAVQQNNRAGVDRDSGANDGHIPPRLSSGVWGAEECADWIWGLYQPQLNPKWHDKAKRASAEYAEIEDVTRLSVVKNRPFAVRDLVGVDLVFDHHSHRLTPKGEKYYLPNVPEMEDEQ